jgi:hypothetical protein
VPRSDAVNGLKGFFFHVGERRRQDLIEAQGVDGAVVGDEHVVGELAEFVCIGFPIDTRFKFALDHGFGSFRSLQYFHAVVVDDVPDAVVAFGAADDASK